MSLHSVLTCKRWRFGSGGNVVGRTNELVNAGPG